MPACPPAKVMELTCRLPTCRVQRSSCCRCCCRSDMSLLLSLASIGHAATFLPAMRFRAIPRAGFVRFRGAISCEGELVRLDKLLAERGAGSRKDVDRMIRKGLVSVQSLETGELEVVGKSGAKLKVPWESSPVVDGFDYPPPPMLAAYYKPLGVVSTMKDDKGRPDLSAVLPQPWQKTLHPVGRLDADTTGLLLYAQALLRNRVRAMCIYIIFVQCALALTHVCVRFSPLLATQLLPRRRPHAPPPPPKVCCGARVPCDGRQPD